MDTNCFDNSALGFVELDWIELTESVKTDSAIDYIHWFGPPNTRQCWSRVHEESSLSIIFRMRFKGFKERAVIKMLGKPSKGEDTVRTDMIYSVTGVTQLIGQASLRDKKRQFILLLFCDTYYIPLSKKNDSEKS